MLKTDVKKSKNVGCFFLLWTGFGSTAGKYYSMYFIIQGDAGIGVSSLIFHHFSDIQGISCLQ